MQDATTVAAPPRPQLEVAGETARRHARLLAEVFDRLFAQLGDSVPMGLADRSHWLADAPVTVTLTADLVSRLIEARADVAEALDE